MALVRYSPKATGFGARFCARALTLHEYQSKELMEKFDVPTQTGFTASTPEETRACVKRVQSQTGERTVVLKAQVLAGGRGKGRLSSGMPGGGIQFVTSAEDGCQRAAKMIGHTLTTHQTGPEGLSVGKLLATEAVDIDKEFYLAIILDRAQGGPCIVCSREGGVEIEEVAKTNPGAIHVIPIKNLTNGPDVLELTAVCEVLFPSIRDSLPKSDTNLSHRQQEALFNSLNCQLKSLVKKLYKLFLASDGSQVEINPLALTTDNRVLCVDAKLAFDDNAQFRQKELFAQEDITTRCPREMAAEAMGMNYITMPEGNVGCLVNGAGLAMATMDLLTIHGGSPANFLDLGGGATKEQVLKSFELLTSDPNVKAIFVNIFGGITRCDVVAQGIVDAARQCNMTRPLIVRLAGNSADKAKQILDKPPAGLKIYYVQDFSTAAKTAADTAKQPAARTA